MAIQFRALTNAGQATATSRIVTKPTGVLQGDKMFFHVLISASGAPAPTMPSGWTLIDEVTGTASNRVYEKTAGASEPADYTVDFGGGSETSILGIIAWYSDVPKNMQVDVFAQQTNTTTMSHVWPSVTTTQTNSVLMCFGSLTVAIPLAPDAAMTERWDTGTSRRFYLMTESLSASGATGTRTATSGSNEDSKNITIALIELDPPVAPSGLTATAVAFDQIDLTWTDNSGNETGFKIEQSPDGVGSWVEINVNAADDNTYSDTGLSPETIYYYRVRATNGDGDSAYSNIDSDTTFLAPADWVTYAGALVETEYDDAMVDVTLAGALVELGVDTLNVTLAGALIEIEELLPSMATFFQSASQPTGTVTHVILPEPITGYQLDDGGSFWGIVLPKPGKNLVLNPSFEVAHGSEVAVGGFLDIDFSFEKASRGFRSLRLIPQNNASGNLQVAYYAQHIGYHTVSVDVYGHPDHNLLLQVFAGVTMLGEARIRPTKLGWERYSLTVYDPLTGSNLRHARLRTDFGNPESKILYVDGFQVEEGSYPTTYMDGEMVESAWQADPYAYGWTGTAHLSPTTRSDKTYGGGQVKSLEDLDFRTTAIVGLGMGDSGLDVATLAGGEEVLRSAWTAGKEFSIIGRIYGTTVLEVQNKRQGLINLLTTVNSRSGLVTVVYQPVNRRGVPVGKRLLIDCVFLAGLTYNFNNLYQDNLELRFRVFNSRMYEEFGTTKELDVDGTSAYETGIYVRDNQTGEWNNYLVGTNATVGGVVKAAAIMDDGSLVVGGSFTAIGGVTARRVARFNPQTNLWEEYGTGFNNTVRALAIGRGRFNGQLLAVGDFTQDGPATFTMRRAAHYDVIYGGWQELGSGFDDVVHDIDVAPNGILLVGGEFANNGPGGVPMVRVAWGNGNTTVGVFAWQTIPISATGDVFTVKIGPDNRYYYGGDFTDLNANLNAKRIAFTTPGASVVDSLGKGVNGTVYDIEFGLDGYLYAAGSFSATSDSAIPLVGFARYLGPLSGDGIWEEVGRGEVAGTFDMLAFDKRGMAYLAGTASPDGPYASPSLTGLFQWTGSAWVPFDFRGTQVSVPHFGNFFVTNNGDFVLPTNGNSTSRVIAGHTTVTYEGTADAPVRLKVTGPAYLFRLSNWTTNKHVYFQSIYVEPDEALVVDLTGLGPRIYSNFYTDRSHQLLGALSDIDAFRLVPGVNHITLTISTEDVLEPPTAVLAWNNRHFSIDAAGDYV